MALDADSDWSARRIESKEDRFCFDVLYRKKLFRRLRLGVYGNYNIRNALATVAILNQLDVSEDEYPGRIGILFRRPETAAVAVRDTTGSEFMKILRTTRPRCVRRCRPSGTPFARSASGLFMNRVPPPAVAMSSSEKSRRHSGWRIAWLCRTFLSRRKCRKTNGLNETQLVEDLRSMGRAAWNLGKCGRYNSEGLRRGSLRRFDRYFVQWRIWRYLRKTSGGI